MDFSSLFVVSHVLTILISTIVKLLVCHPYTVHSFFAVASGYPGPCVHALVFDKLQFGTHFEYIFLGHYFFFLLNDGG